MKLGLLLAVGMTVGVTMPVVAETPVERGEYLVETIMGCGNCHTPQGPNGPDPSKVLAGGFVIEDGPFRAVTSNITQDKATGIGGWSDEEIAVAIREGIRPDGSLIGPPMPFGFYRNIGDEDLAAIVAYLRTVPAIENKVEKSRYDIPLPPAWGPTVETVSAPARAVTAEYGAYLAGPLGHCLECHTPMLPTGQPDHAKLGWGGFPFNGPWGQSVSADLTPTALGDWSDAEIVAAITTGVSRDGHHLKPPMGFAYYAGMTPDDLAALVAYLRTLPPSSH
jgi:mono/diheme cytochrome c family protein